MAQARSRPRSRGGIVSDLRAQSVSGHSTASRESSVAAETFWGNENGYAPIRPQPPTLDTQISNQARQNFESLSATSRALEQVQQYNGQQSPALSNGFYAPEGYHPAQQHAPIRSVEELQVAEARPLSRAGTVDQGTRNSTPALDEGGKKEKKNASATAANEKELRELLDANKNRSLDSIARDVRNAERTQKSERAKQLYAMRWLKEFCMQDEESVPRNRVYTHYAQRCGTDRVDVLNAASFGKLVRIIFPGIQTRRLGVRGESKYHYVHLKLREDPQVLFGRPPSAGNDKPHERTASTEQEFSFKQVSPCPEQDVTDFHFSHAPRASTDTAAFPTRSETMQILPHNLHSNPRSNGCLFTDHLHPGYRHNRDVPQMYPQTIKFSSEVDMSDQNEVLTLPDIWPFAPPKTDADLTDALTALYRTHCTSLIDAVRYVKEKQFFRLLGTFNGTMTVPVSKLFASPTLAPWIKQCDTHMYQQIIRFLSQLALQVMPPQVFNMLGKVSNTLTHQIENNFHQYPSHVLQAKLEPATVFASLLSRLLRVNETAHAAANLLTNDQVRNLMWQDWVRSVRPKRVIESELPGCGYEEAYVILTKDIRQLLEPLESADFIEASTDFDRSLLGTKGSWLGDNSNAAAEGILERWAGFLKSLPSRFPKAHTRTLLHCVNAIGTGTLRDITVSQAQSFGSWWITKTWVDEMMLWTAEMGGFLDAKGLGSSDSPNQSEALTSVLEADHRPSDKIGSIGSARPNGLGIDFQHMSAFDTQGRGGNDLGDTQMSGFHFSPKHNDKGQGLSLELSDGNDDSGLGMSLISNDFQGMTNDFGRTNQTLVNDIMAR